MSIIEKNDLVIIKKRILEEELIEKILEELECENIRNRRGRWEAQLPLSFGSKNKRAVQIYENKYLSSKIRNKGVNGDIYLLIGYILYKVTDFEELQTVLYQVKAWICNTLGWSNYLFYEDDFEEEKKDYLSFLRPIQASRKKRKRKQYLTQKENVVLDKDNIFNWYKRLPHINFLEDGINIKTQNEFEIMFDQTSERVLFPIYNRDGELVSLKGRYVGKDDFILEEYKYLYMHFFDKTIELFNLHRALPYIEKSGEVIIFESEKSCMKAHQYGYKNTVAIMGSDLSPVQAFTLRELGVNIIFAYDNDVDLEFIKSQTKQIKTRKCFYLKDEFGLLGEKFSPVDGGKTTWEKIYKECVKVI